ncbi:hypothetical protein D9M68_857670 [compost metagenome]
MVDARSGNRRARIEVAQDADDVLVDQLLGDLHANPGIGLVVARDQHEGGRLAVDLDALLVGFFQGQVQAVLHVFAVVRLRAGQRRSETELDVGGLRGGGHAGGGETGGDKLQSGAELHGYPPGCRT